MTPLLAVAGSGTESRCPFPYLPPAASALARLEPKACRWPLGEPLAADFAFCAKIRTLGSCYCQDHRRLARSAR